jgi:hypothetical protein
MSRKRSAYQNSLLTAVIVVSAFVCSLCAAEMPYCGDYWTEYMYLRVVDADTHMPIAGAEVIVQAYVELEWWTQEQEGCRLAVGHGTTDSEGDAVVQVGCPAHDNVCGSRKHVEVRHEGYHYLELSYNLEGTWDSVGAMEKGDRVGPMKILRMLAPVTNPDGTKWGLTDDEFYGFVAQVELKPIRRN